MASSIADAQSTLVVDVGSVHTRAMLFDVVDGRYRFLAAGQAMTTAAAPFFDVSEGVRQAIDQLQQVTTRRLLREDFSVIIPAEEEGLGVDKFAATLSAGEPLKIVAVGLLEDISLQSACQLANATYASVVHTIHLNDRSKPEERIDAIIRLRPDLVIAAGGTEGGASQSVLRMLEPVGLACYLMPPAQRPALLFAGNQKLWDEIEASYNTIAELHFAPNVRPALEAERLEAGQAELAAIYSRRRLSQLRGVQELNEWSHNTLLPTPSAMGRLVRFLSSTSKSGKGVLGLDIGASATSIAVSTGGDLSLHVFPEYGLGKSLGTLLDRIPLNHITRWLPVNVPLDYVRNYLYNKSLYPATVPATEEDLAIEEALVRQILRATVRRASANQRGEAGNGSANHSFPLLPPMEPIIAAGSVLTQAPDVAHAMLMILDGLQPTGVSTVVLDQNHLASALGAAAASNPLMAVQVLDSNTFSYLGTVISPVSKSRPGTPILRMQIKYENGQETAVDIKQGGFEMFPLPLGQTAQVQLQPLHRSDVGMGATGRGGKLRIHGGLLGLIVDARGRPLPLLDDPVRRMERFKKWLWTLGGQP